MTLEEAKNFLKVETNEDNELIKKDLKSAIALVNQFIFPRVYDDNKDTPEDERLDDDEKKVADKVIQFILHKYYYERSGEKLEKWNKDVEYMLNPLRSIVV